MCGGAIKLQRFENGGAAYGVRAGTFAISAQIEIRSEYYGEDPNKSVTLTALNMGQKKCCLPCKCIEIPFQPSSTAKQYHGDWGENQYISRPASYGPGVMKTFPSLQKILSIRQSISQWVSQSEVWWWTWSVRFSFHWLGSSPYLSTCSQEGRWKRKCMLRSWDPPSRKTPRR